MKTKAKKNTKKIAWHRSESAVGCFLIIVCRAFAIKPACVSFSLAIQWASVRSALADKQNENVEKIATEQKRMQQWNK